MARGSPTRRSARARRWCAPRTGSAISSSTGRARSGGRGSPSFRGAAPWSATTTVPAGCPTGTSRTFRSTAGSRTSKRWCPRPDWRVSRCSACRAARRWRSRTPCAIRSGSATWCSPAASRAGAAVAASRSRPTRCASSSTWFAWAGDGRTRRSGVTSPASSCRTAASSRSAGSTTCSASRHRPRTPPGSSKPPAASTWSACCRR